MSEWNWSWNGKLENPSGDSAASPVESIMVSGIAVRAGGRVRLRPKAGGDIMDLALAGKAAIVEAIERDFEDRLHVAVVLEDDPGRDLGMLRQPGHRFFFSPQEIEPLDLQAEGTAQRNCEVPDEH
jgi:hypothetical protein